MEKLLMKLGLGNKEQVIYRLILEYGKIAPAHLSRLAKINRTTVYSVAKELCEKGLIIEDLGGKTLYYLPAREKELEKIVEEEKKKIEEKESSIRELQEFLRNFPASKTYSVPKIRFIDESDLERYLYEAFPKWAGSMKQGDATWWGFQDHTAVERFEKWIDWSWDHSPKEISLKLFTNDSDIEQKMKKKKYAERRELKFWNTEEFSASQLIAGDYVLLLATKNRPYYMVEINDAVMAHNLRTVFKTLWTK